MIVAWVQESDQPMRAALERRGYTMATTTRAMGMELDDIALPARGSSGIYNVGTVEKARRRGSASR